MVIPPFSFSGIPRVFYGVGTFREIPRHLKRYGSSVLIVTGGNSLQKSGRLDELKDLMEQASLKSSHVSVDREPSPEMVDSAVVEFGKGRIDAVLAVGGGAPSMPGRPFLP